VSWDKKANKCYARIQIDGIRIHLGNYDTIEEATIARVNKVKKAFGQYVNKSEGVNHGQKPMKIRKSKTFFKPIVKPNIQMIFDDIATLKNNYKNELL
jgi:hypothetical protein